MIQPVLPPSHRSLPLFGTQRTRAIEQHAAASLPPHTLMRRAGAAVARLALALAPHAQRVWIAAGPGNNGGDGLEAAMQLRAAGKAVQVTLLADTARLPDDAKDAWQRARAAGVAIGAAMPQEVGTHDLTIDALLGIGASRAPEAAIADVVRLLCGMPCPVLAIDVPSGLDATTGQPLGDTCVTAQHTLSLLSLKPGLFTGTGRDHAGRVWFDDLGVATGEASPEAWLSGSSVAAAAPRAHARHKGSFGDVVVIGGAAGMTGAALLAARAAHAAGAGRVYASLLDGDMPMPVDPLRPELMFRREMWRDDHALRTSTVVCGCGGGDAVRAVMPRLLGAASRLVLDADALNTIAADTSLQSLLEARASRQRWTVLTPHPLEAARLLASTAGHVQADRLQSAQALAERFACVVLLKGSGTVIAAPGTAPRINPTGNAALATAGTGDVLAGWLGGLWAQRGDAATLAGANAAACAAAYLHGAAADAHDGAVLRAADLVERIAPAG